MLLDKFLIAPSSVTSHQCTAECVFAFLTVLKYGGINIL